MRPSCAQVDAQRARLPQTRAKGEYEMENTIKVLQHKEAKLSACRQSFKEHEALVYHQVRVGWGLQFMVRVGQHMGSGA